MSFDSNYDENPPNPSQNIRSRVHYSEPDVEFSFEPYHRFPTRSETEFTGSDVTHLDPQSIRDEMSIDDPGELDGGTFDSNYDELSNPPNPSQNIRNRVYSARDVTSYDADYRFPVESENEFTGSEVTDFDSNRIPDRMSIEDSGELGIFDPNYRFPQTSTAAQIQYPGPDQGTEIDEEPPLLELEDFELIQEIDERFQEHMVIAKSIKDNNKLVAIKIIPKVVESRTKTIPSHLRTQIDVMMWKDDRFPFWSKFYGVIPGFRFTGLVSEYVTYGTIRKLAFSVDLFDPEETRYMISEIVVGLEYLHQHSIAYGSIYNNDRGIRITHDLHIKLTDFSNSIIGDYPAHRWDQHPTPLENRPPNPYESDWYALGHLTFSILDRTGYEAKDGKLEYQNGFEDIFDLKEYQDCHDFIAHLTGPNWIAEEISHQDVISHKFLQRVCWPQVRDQKVQVPARLKEYQIDNEDEFAPPSPPEGGHPPTFPDLGIY